jgi:hypothetical protein
MASSLLRRHSPLASGRVSREFSVFCFIGPNLHQIRDAEVQISSDRFGVFPPYSVESSGESKISPREK